jgi:membrane peptidoglycan carboxypeptidase
LRVAVVTALLALAAVSVGGFFALANYERYADDFVPPDALAVNQPSLGARIVDREGRLLYDYLDDEVGVRIPVTLDEVSPAFLAATIATEDASFFDNTGVNMRGLVRAASENLNILDGDDDLLAGSGGSSITQQLVKNVYIPREQRTERSLDRKLREVVYALELTARYDKIQILEWYVNEISYGGVYTGVEAASRGYFGKPARELTLAEAALLAGIPQSPAAFDPISNPEAALARRDQVLDLIAGRQSIKIGLEAYYTPPPEEIAAARAEPVTVLQRSFPIAAPHFVLTYIGPQVEKLVGREALLRNGLVVTTTLDLDLQLKSEELIDRWVGEFEAISNTHNGAALIIEPRTGEVLAMVGSRDYFREDIDGNVNNLFAPNSPGSTFKPFVYLTAFERLGWSPGTIIQDTPVSFRESDGTVFRPTNPNKGFNGPITLRNALGNSLNVPAFKAAQSVGVDAILAYTRSVGFTSLNGQYGPAIAIGGVDLKPFDLTYGYGVIANGGVIAGQSTFAPSSRDERTIEPIGILKIVDRDGNVLFDIEQHRAQKQVVRPEHAYMISDILSDPRAQCLTFGCGGLNIPGHRAGVKTGTSEPYDPKGPDAGKIGETWAFGFTPEYVVGVWAGNSNNEPIVHIYSTSIAFRAMRDMLLAAHDGRPSSAFVRPANVTSRQVCVEVLSPEPIPGAGNRPNQDRNERQLQCSGDLVAR